jgi:hypothetical protein
MPHSGHTRSCKGGCGTVVSYTWWCPRCAALRGKQPPKYGGAHQAKRKAERPSMYGKPCCRCGRPLSGPIMLDHDDNDPTRYLGWAHAKCNLSAGARLGNAIQNGRARRVSTPSAPAPKVEVDPEWGDGWFRPDGTPLRQHSFEWSEGAIYPQLAPGWTPPGAA